MRRGRGAIAAGALASLAAASGSCNQLVGADDFRVEARPGDVVDRPCSSNVECAARNGGAPAVCRRADGACVPLASDGCDYVIGDVFGDDAVVIGAIAPTSGPGASVGLAMRNALFLALRDFTDASNGLPPAGPGGAPRSLALVGCDQAVDPLRAARHLAEGLGVPAIIGAAFSGITGQIAEEVTVPAGTLLMSPSATSPSLTALPDRGLLWRTAPSDVLQGRALALLAGDLVARLRGGEPPEAKPVALAALHKGDSYGVGLADEAARVLEAEGALAPGDRLVRLDYGNPDDLASTPDPDAKYAEAVAALVAQRPQLVLALGTNETVAELLPLIEAAWPEGGPRPVYLFSEGAYVPELRDVVEASAAGLRERVFGTRPGAFRGPFGAFRGRYESAFSDGTSAESVGAAGAFDAFYLLAFALASLPPGADGPAVARALGRLVPPGEPVDVGPEGIAAAAAALARGENVDVRGASGALDFDPATGEAPSDILVWCPAPAGAPAGALPVDSGRFLDQATLRLEGTLACAPAPAPPAPTP